MNYMKQRRKYKWNFILICYYNENENNSTKADISKSALTRNVMRT